MDRPTPEAEANAIRDALTRMGEVEDVLDRQHQRDRKRGRLGWADEPASRAELAELREGMRTLLLLAQGLGALRLARLAGGDEDLSGDQGDG